MRLKLEPKRVIPPVLFGVLAIAYLLEALTFDNATSAEAPILYGCVLLALSILAGVLALRPKPAEDPLMPRRQHQDGPVDIRRAVEIFLLIALLIGLIFLLGFYLALFVFVTGFLWRVSKVSLLRSLTAGILASAITWFVFGWFLSLEVYAGYLGQLIGS
jgi:uncharacterized protein YqhQ